LLLLLFSNGENKSLHPCLSGHVFQSGSSLLLNWDHPSYGTWNKNRKEHHKRRIVIYTVGKMS